MYDAGEHRTKYQDSMTCTANLAPRHEHSLKTKPIKILCQKIKITKSLSKVASFLKNELTAINHLTRLPADMHAGSTCSTQLRDRCIST